MHKSKKIAVGVIGGLVVSIMAISFLSSHRIEDEKNGPYIDEFGWKHGVHSKNSIYPSDDNLSRTYALIDYDKKIMAEMDAHSFVNQITSILDSYKDSQWYYTTFVFDDGTGLFFPDSDISEPATYGEINNKGVVTAEYGVVTVTGMNVTYSETKSSFNSNDSKSLLESMPESYLSDDLCAIIQDNVIYITFYEPMHEVGEDGTLIITVLDEEKSRIAVEQFYEEFKATECEYIDTCDAIYIALANNGQGYSISADGTATYVENLGEKINEVIMKSAEHI